VTRLDLASVFGKLIRDKGATAAYGARDAALVEWSKSDGYRALLDLYEREMRAVFMAWLMEKDPSRLEGHRAMGRALFTLIRRVDERAATVQAAESVQQAAERAVADLAVDRAEMTDLDRAVTERAFQAAQVGPTGRRRFSSSQPDTSGAY
jgi:hypothetical protein